MIKNTQYLVAALFLSFCLTLAPSLGAETESFGILAPYAGRVSNKYSNAAYRLNLDETGLMTGFFAQWIRPRDFQVNTFFYYAPKAEMTDVMGAHLNADYYPVMFTFGKLVTGVDLEAIKIHTEGPLKGLESFELTNNVITAMPRVGVSVPVVSEETFQVVVFPYAGVSFESVSGDALVNPMGPTPLISTPISESSTYASLGLNLTFRLFHALEVQGKYLAGFKSENRFDSISVLMNAFFSRDMALSYRFKNMDLLSGSNQYHLLGLAVVL